MEGLTYGVLPETPPRTWRRLIGGADIRRVAGNTSTDVEKTDRVDHAVDDLKKHLHGRGEDLPPPGRPVPILETPPRTWRRPKKARTMRDELRNTSTDVEKTSRCHLRAEGFGKHLHGRGEDCFNPKSRIVVIETPPRTWRRRPAKGTFLVA